MFSRERVVEGGVQRRRVSPRLSHSQPAWWRVATVTAAADTQAGDNVIISDIILILQPVNQTRVHSCLAYFLSLCPSPHLPQCELCRLKSLLIDKNVRIFLVHHKLCIGSKILMIKNTFYLGPAIEYGKHQYHLQNSICTEFLTLSELKLENWGSGHILYLFCSDNVCNNIIVKTETRFDWK